jgi:hypothetical protein
MLNSILYCVDAFNVEVGKIAQVGVIVAHQKFIYVHAISLQYEVQFHSNNFKSIVEVFTQFISL